MSSRRSESEVRQLCDPTIEHRSPSQRSGPHSSPQLVTKDVPEGLLSSPNFQPPLLYMLTPPWKCSYSVPGDKEREEEKLAGAMPALSWPLVHSMARSDPYGPHTWPRYGPIANSCFDNLINHLMS